MTLRTFLFVFTSAGEFPLTLRSLHVSPTCIINKQNVDAIAIINNHLHTIEPRLYVYKKSKPTPANLRFSDEYDESKIEIKIPLEFPTLTVNLIWNEQLLASSLLQMDLSL